MMKHRSSWLVAATILVGSSAHSAGLAPLPVAPAAPASDTATFAPAYFASYNPVTAADMVSRIPGFELKDGDDRRGFGGSAGNLLINGERPSSKATPSDLLKRIPAAEVTRIEVMAGTSAQADVRGQSQFVNVITRATKKAASASYTVGLRHIQFSDRIGFVTQLSGSVPLGAKAELDMDFQSPNILGRSENRDVLMTGNHQTTGSRIFVGRPTNLGAQGSAHLRWQATPVDAVNLNVQYAPNWWTTDSFQLEALPNGALSSSIYGRTDYPTNYTLELGGDWDHKISATLAAKLVILLSNGDLEQRDRFDTFTAPTAYLTRVQDRTTNNGERIIRGRLKWTASEAHTFEFGAEGAFNFRDTGLRITNQLPGKAPTPVVLPVADARVEEKRGEIFASDIWTVTPKLTIETDLNVEASRITQSGDQHQQRDFKYIKPRLIATYTLSPKSTLHASLIRDVSQLDFAEFSSAVDFVNTSTIIGNPNLKPEKAWKFRAEWESRLSTRSALTAAAFYDKIEDVHDLVVLNGVDAFGNIGAGTRIGAEIRASMPLNAVGIANAELRLNGIYQKTQVTDPVTGQKRSFSVPLERQGTAAGAPVLNGGNKDWAYVVNFRQNLPSLESSWGVILTQWAGRQEFRRAEAIKYVRKEPRIDLFLRPQQSSP
ncbi:MAG: hypothetical protein CGW95_10950 [Phenylobacterium zucineum]|nr:MAG: hypothetical protein CGW95_10950 [Phenylobacterium zucineum]